MKVDVSYTKRKKNCWWVAVYSAWHSRARVNRRYIKGDREEGDKEIKEVKQGEIK